MRFIRKKTIQKYSQTAGERNEIDEILKPVLLAQRIYGLQILNPDWTWKKYGIYRVFTFMLCTYVTIGTIDTCKQTTDLNVIIEGIFTMSINVQMTLKLLIFAGQHKNMQRNYVQAKNYIYDLIKVSPSKRDRALRNLKLLVKILVIVIVLPVCSYLLLALGSAVTGNRVTLSRSTSTLMPMTSPYFEIGLLIHLCYLTEAAFCLLVPDLWFIFLCFFFLDASEVSIEILNVERNGDNDELYAERLEDSLRRFYVVHVEMMQFLNLINDIYKWLSLAPIMANIIGTSLFLMLMKEELNLQILVVMLPATGEIIAFNWFGETIRTKTENINMALLQFNWTSMKIKDQKKYFIIACYMNKEFGVKTAVGNDLSLLTLSTIYKASYQMFTVFSTT